MHISSQRHSPNFDPACFDVVSLTVDGVEVMHDCVEFNDDEGVAVSLGNHREGWATVFKKGPDGKHIIRNSELVKELIAGEVVVTFHEYPVYYSE